jgi:DNA modification methylase
MANNSKHLRIVNRLNWYRLASPRSDNDLSIYNWYPYKHGYARGLVSNLIDEMSIEPGMKVLDAFCGGGTTLLACQEKGIQSLGVDIVPFAVFLSNTKVDNYNYKKVMKYIEYFKENGIEIVDYPGTDIVTIEKAFNKKMLNYLYSLKKEIDKVEEEKYKNLLLLAFFSILEESSKTSKSGGFLRLVERKTNPKLSQELFMSRLESFAKDIKNAKRNIKLAEARVGDSRYFNTKMLFDAVITSPPYPNRHDYTRIYLLELAFGFINEDDKIKELRYKTIRSHVEAKSPYKIERTYTPSKYLKSLVGKIKKRKPNNNMIEDMLYGYFEDMYMTLKNIKRLLKKGARVAFVVSNVRYCGINVPVDKLLARTGEAAGLSTEKIIVMRYRGNTPQQIVKYKRKPSRESIVIWKYN